MDLDNSVLTGLLATLSTEDPLYNYFKKFQRKDSVAYEDED